MSFLVKWNILKRTEAALFVKAEAICNCCALLIPSLIGKEKTTSFVSKTCLFDDTEFLNCSIFCWNSCSFLQVPNQNMFSFLCSKRYFLSSWLIFEANQLLNMCRTAPVPWTDLIAIFETAEPVLCVFIIFSYIWIIKNPRHDWLPNSQFSELTHKTTFCYWGFPTENGIFLFEVLDIMYENFGIDILSWFGLWNLEPHFFEIEVLASLFSELRNPFCECFIKFINRNINFLCPVEFDFETKNNFRNIWSCCLVRFWNFNF